MAAEGLIFDRTRISPMGTQIPVSNEAREALRLYKILSGHDTYGDAIIALMEDAGHEVPDHELSEEELVERVFSG
jgi:hypothetical protein